jgi:metal-sulfur cluster biosynthetic enzyme
MLLGTKTFCYLNQHFSGQVNSAVRTAGSWQNWEVKQTHFWTFHLFFWDISIQILLDSTWQALP